MNYTQEVFIKLLSEYIDENWNFTIDEEKVDWNKLVELSSIHSVCGIIYLSLKEKNVNRKKLMEYLQCRFNKESGFAIRQQILYDRTLSLFEKYGIKNIVSKGISNDEVKGLVDSVMNEVFYTILLGLDGETSLGDVQMQYKVYDENDNLLDGIESYVYESFMNEE